MVIDLVLLLAPVMVAAHTLEELRDPQDFVAAYMARLPPWLTSRSVLRSAAFSLMAVTAVLCVGAVVLRSGMREPLALVAIGALTLNALSHCLLSIQARRWLPGTRSAVVLLLPYGLISLAALPWSGAGESWKVLGGQVLLGAAVVPLSVAVSLALGYGITRLQAHHRRLGQ